MTTQENILTNSERATDFVTSPEHECLFPLNFLGSGSFSLSMMVHVKKLWCKKNELAKLKLSVKRVL